MFQVQIRFGDLKREYDKLQEELDSAVQRVLRSGWFILSQELDRFEQAADATFSLPMYPQLSDDEVHQVVDAIREFCI